MYIIKHDLTVPLQKTISKVCQWAFISLRSKEIGDLTLFWLLALFNFLRNDLNIIVALMLTFRIQIKLFHSSLEQELFLCVFVFQFFVEIEAFGQFRLFPSSQYSFRLRCIDAPHKFFNRRLNPIFCTDIIYKVSLAFFGLWSFCWTMKFLTSRVKWFLCFWSAIFRFVIKIGILRSNKYFI